MEQLSQKELYDEWLDKIKTAEGRYSDYYKLISEIREYYRNDRKKNKQNDESYNDNIQWIELYNVKGEKGWVYGESEYISFITKNKVIFIKTERLR